MIARRRCGPSMFGRSRFPDVSMPSRRRVTFPHHARPVMGQSGGRGEDWAPPSRAAVTCCAWGRRSEQILVSGVPEWPNGEFRVHRPGTGWWRRDKSGSGGGVSNHRQGRPWVRIPPTDTSHSDRAAGSVRSPLRLRGPAAHKTPCPLQRCPAGRVRPPSQCFPGLQGRG